jgi:hypothetical protein
VVGCPAAGQTLTGSREIVAALPHDAQVVVAASELGRQRATPAGKAFEAFLTGATDWSRTAGAWAELSKLLEMQPDAAAAALLGGTAVVVGLDAGKPLDQGPLALVSEISPETRRLLNHRLDVVPRSVVAGVPVLSLEGGRFELAAVTPRAGTNRFILSGDHGLFESLVASQGGRPQAGALSRDTSWQHYAALADSDLFVLLREPADTPAGFFALGGQFTPDGWTGRFVGSDSMMLAGLASTGPAWAPWPSEAVDALEQGATLLVAGSTDLHGAAGKPTLMTSLLGMLNLPPTLRAGLEGHAVISLRLDEESGIARGGTLVLALPIRDIARSAPLADAWALSVAGVTTDRVSELVRIADGIYTAPLAAERPVLFRDRLGGQGRVAWCYASPGTMKNGAAPGWIVLSIRLGDGEDPVLTARRVSSLLAHDQGRDRATLFRLVVEPRLLMGIVAGEGAPGHEPALDDVRLSAMRWLRRVETRVSREAEGLVEGSIALRFNMPAASALPAEQRGPQPQQGE